MYGALALVEKWCTMYIDKCWCTIHAVFLEAFKIMWYSFERDGNVCDSLSMT
jgi:hypothetical protein